MAVSFFVVTCCKLSKHISPEKADKIAPAIDIIVGIGLLMLGLLGANSMLAITPAASWALIGMGSIYTALVFGYLLTICTDSLSKQQSEEQED